MTKSETIDSPSAELASLRSQNQRLKDNCALWAAAYFKLQAEMVAAFFNNSRTETSAASEQYDAVRNAAEQGAVTRLMERITDNPCRARAVNQSGTLE